MTVNGTAGADSIQAKASSFGHDILGLPAKVFLTGAEPGDRLTINGGDGEDTIDAQQMTKDKLQPFLNGGAAKDIIVGSSGQDEVTGGPGDDVSSCVMALTRPSGSPATAATSSRAGPAPTSCA